MGDISLRGHGIERRKFAKGGTPAWQRKEGKSESTISKKAYANMKAGFPKRKKMAKGGIAKGCGCVMENRRKVTKVF